jgi:hypothetical protein
MCEQVAKKPASVELSDIFLKHAETYMEQRGVSAHQYKAIRAISQCRTSALGGHALGCNHCGAQDISYNSCRYRHCPKCQTTKQLRWLDERTAELLPTHYFHVVFTLPHELNPLASYNQAAIYTMLFKAAWLTIETFGKDKKQLAGQMGMLAFLHTWGQNLSQHNHLHCMIPGGALYKDEAGNQQWRASKKDFLFSSRAMAKYFGKAFITLLERAFSNNELNLKGGIAELSESTTLAQFMVRLRKKSWNVYAKEPFNGAQGGLAYLARYFAKTAIGNERILSCDEKQVRFKWCDYADNNKTKIMTLDAHEFIRRYLSHILPDGFMRVRSFGLLANACKAKNIATIRSLLQSKSSTNKILNRENASVPPTEKLLITAIDDINTNQSLENSVDIAHTPSPMTEHTADTSVIKSKPKESITELMKRIAGIDIELCKHCKVGRLEKRPLPSGVTHAPEVWDTS